MWGTSLMPRSSGLPRNSAGPGLIVMPAADAEILVVDDEPACADEVCEYLVRRGHSAAASYSGAEALAACARNPQLRLIVSDIRMPGMSGFQLFDAVAEQALASGWEPPAFIFLTGHAGQVEADIADAIGVDGFMTKPVNPRELLGRIGDIFREHQTLTEAGARHDA